MSDVCFLFFYHHDRNLYLIPLKFEPKEISINENCKTQYVRTESQTSLHGFTVNREKRNEGMLMVDSSFQCNFVISRQFKEPSLTQLCSSMRKNLNDLLESETSRNPAEWKKERLFNFCYRLLFKYVDCYCSCIIKIHCENSNIAPTCT